MTDKGMPAPCAHALTAAAAASPVRLTPDERRVYGHLFRIADSEQVGVVTGTAAVEFFKKSGLSPALLAQVPRRHGLLCGD